MCRSCQCSQSGSSHRPQSQNRFSHHDQHELEPYAMINMMIVNGILMNKSLFAYSSQQNTYSIKQTNVTFDEIDTENMPRVFTDL